MRWRNTKASQNVEDYRGRRTGGGGGGMKFGIVGLVAIVGAYFLGIDPRLIMGLLGGGTAHPTQRSARGSRHAHRTKAASSSRTCWATPKKPGRPSSAAAGQQYVAPRLALFGEGINTGCGSATSAAGPFYCPPDQKVYIDLTFFRQLETEFAAQGDFAKAYVIAHEVGHHVQNLLGTAEKVRAAQQRASEADANALSVKHGTAGGLLTRASGRTTPTARARWSRPVTSTKRSTRLRRWATTPSRNASRVT